MPQKKTYLKSSVLGETNKSPEKIQVKKLETITPAQSNYKGKERVSAINPKNYSLWTDKYKPTSYSEIIGNKSNVDKVVTWLKQW